jgi:hypothetical protein
VIEDALPFDTIVFVCAHQRAPGERVACANPGRDGQALLEGLKAAVKARGWETRVRVSKSGCVGHRRPARPLGTDPAGGAVGTRRHILPGSPACPAWPKPWLVRIPGGRPSRLRFQRIQFTPDLLPADVVGTWSYNPKTTGSSREFEAGPGLHQPLLADEINRAPAKVQSALLEAMQERQVTIGDTTYALPEPFIVLATQNPIEQEGTYPLPEAQVDRFMLKVKVTYPAAQAFAFLRGRGYVTPEDIKAIGPDVLRHRIVLTYEAEAEEKTADDIVQRIFNEIEVP